MDTEQNKDKKLHKEFYLNLIGYSIIIFLLGSMFCILYFEVGFYNIWIFIKKLTVVSIDNWYVSLPILGMIVGFVFIICLMFSSEVHHELLMKGWILILGSFLIFLFLSMPIMKAHHKAAKEQTKIEEQQENQIQITQPNIQR